ncbi:MAG: hypothetical protein ACJ76L_02700 [Conexibacter sp.]
MSQVSRPMQIALGATLLLLVVWFVALRPKPSTGDESASAPAPAQTTPAPSSGAAPGTAGLTGAIDKAHEAVTTADGDAARAEQSDADAPAATGGAAAAPAAGADPARAARAGSGGSARPSKRPIHTHGPVASVRVALKLHKAVAVAFVDSATADSQAVERELLAVSHFGGRAFTIAVPLADLSDYSFITKTVEVTVAPTVVIVDPRRRATTIVGFTDRGEIEQRLADALATKRR